MADIFTGNISFPDSSITMASIQGREVKISKVWYKFFNDIYRNTRVGDTALNGLLSNTNLSEAGAAVTLISGSTLNIAGTLNITGDFTFDGAAPDDGKLLIGHNSNGTYQEGNLTSANSLLTVTNNAGAISLTVNNNAIDHGTLVGLGDDDHTQYHNDARALTWLGTRSTSDLSEGTNLYYTDERVDDQVNALLQDNSGLSWSYDDGAGTLTPTVDHDALTNYVAEEHIDWTSTSENFNTSGTVTLDGLTADSLLALNSSKAVINPTAGNGISYSSDTLSVDFNTTNLQITANQINTIQDIATSSSPTFAAATINGNITVTGTVDGRDVASDGGKLDNIEANADVTDETNVLSALNGASITGATVATGDDVLFQDISNSDNLRVDSALDLADLGHPAFYAELGSPQSINNASVTVIELDAEALDTHGYFNNTTTYRYTPLIPGVYFFLLVGYLDSVSVGTRLNLYIRKNGSSSTQVFRRLDQPLTGGSFRMSNTTSYLVSMNGSTDYIDFRVYQDDGAAVDLLAANATYAFGFRIGSS